MITSVSEWEISLTERCTIVGKTGSGKTYLSRALLHKSPRLIVLDPKGTIRNSTWHLDNWSNAGYNDLLKGKDCRLRIPPPVNKAEWEYYFEKIYKIRGGVRVYIDEMYAVGPAKGSEGLIALLTRGRELEIGLVMSTQRPVWVPSFILSEAEWVIMFNLQKLADKQRMADDTNLGDSALSTKLDKHGFLLYNPHLERVFVYKQVRIVSSK